MSKLIFSTLLCMLLAVGFACAGDDHDHGDYADKEEAKEAPATAPATQPADGEPVNTVCPVEGGDVDKSVTTVYDGKVIGFCCDHCIPEFKKDPEKYMKNLK
jgi:YHS domain-containing protein